MESIGQKHFFLTLGIAAAGACILRMPSDDALRHAGLAFGEFSGWGKVYPYSVFEMLGDFNPWAGYDMVLRTLASLGGILAFDGVAFQVVLVKGVSLILGACFLYLAMRASCLGREIRDQSSFSLACILIVLIMPSFLRIIIARPFAFGSLFLLYSCQARGLLKGIAAASILSFFYPYLAWFYTIPVGIAHILAGDKRFAFGCIACTLCLLLLMPQSFWGFQIELFLSDSYRSALDSQIGEFMGTLKYAWFYVFIILIILSGPALIGKRSQSMVALWLLLIYSPPAIKYVRYFVDITLPLFFVAYARPLLAYWLKAHQGIWRFWEEKIRELPFASSESNRNLLPLLGVAYALVFILLVFQSTNQMNEFRQFKKNLESVPKDSLVLSDFNLQYKTLFVRPDLRLIPSCELGFAAAGIRKEYKNFLDHGIVSGLAKQTGAKYLIENRNMYIDPTESLFLERMLLNDELNIWKIQDA